jgi:diaminopimelate epimerase
MGFTKRQLAGGQFANRQFAKGHGTENDFVILPDEENDLGLSAVLAARLCDRRAGVGADGVLRVVRTAALDDSMPGLAGAGSRRPAVQPDWFMDYRNADGSIAEMCGNGIRVFARYLLAHGLAEGPEFAVATRSGVRQVRVEPDGRITVEMGPATVLGPGYAVVGGAGCPGLRISVGNPHLACLVGDALDKFDLSAPPELDPADFPAGGNVELVRVTGPAALSMRVHERGSGETRSCGTGAVAVAAAAAAAAAPPAGPGSWQVTVPGGELTVTLDGRTSWLTGPAVIVAEGELDASWLASAGSA